MSMTTAEFQVSGMSCGHCEVAVRGEVSGIAGVESIEVSAATGRLLVTSTAALPDQAVLDAVDEAGYSATRVA
jgi:copper chaperone